MGKSTLVMGASTNPDRYSFRAISRLVAKGNLVVAYGNKPGEVSGIKIDTNPIDYQGIDTITMYLGAENQIEYYDYILGLRPKRLIFNPGAENEEFEKLARSSGIETENACTLVLLSTNQF